MSETIHEQHMWEGVIKSVLTSNHLVVNCRIPMRAQLGERWHSGSFQDRFVRLTTLGGEYSYMMLRRRDNRKVMEDDGVLYFRPAYSGDVGMSERPMISVELKYFDFGGKERHPEEPSDEGVFEEDCRTRRPTRFRGGYGLGSYGYTAKPQPPYVHKMPDQMKQALNRHTSLREYDCKQEADVALVEYGLGFDGSLGRFYGGRRRKLQQPID